MISFKLNHNIKSTVTLVKLTNKVEKIINLDKDLSKRIDEIILELSSDNFSLS